MTVGEPVSEVQNYLLTIGLDTYKQQIAFYKVVHDLTTSLRGWHTETVIPDNHLY